MTKTIEQSFAQKLRDVLERFSALDPKGPSAKPMAITEAIAFLLVNEQPGKTVNDYAALAGISPTSMSRYLLDLGERQRTGVDGLGLVEGRPNLLDRREVQYRPTDKGTAFMFSLVGRMVR